MLDYIYLLLIFILIGSILFFIYLSYEYRQANVERFIVPQINQLSQLEISETGLANTKQINSFLKNYKDLLGNTYNRQIFNDTIDYQTLNKQALSNLNDSVILSKQNNGLIQTAQAFPINQLIKTIKSNYNSQYLSLFANDVNKYGILVNDKCMTVNGLCKDEYCLQDCQNSLYTTDSQKFYTNRINSANDVARIMHITPDKVSSKNIYPFNIFQSNINNKCLVINNDGVSIDKCNLNSINQQWSISPDENICILN